MGILLHKAGRLPVAELFWGMQGHYPRHFVLYGSGFTAEQSEAIGASSLPAETLLVVFMENYSPVPWVPPQQVLMLLVTRAEVL